MTLSAHPAVPAQLCHAPLSESSECCIAAAGMSAPEKYRNPLQDLDTLAVEECSLRETELEYTLHEGAFHETGDTGGRWRGSDMAREVGCILFDLCVDLYGALRAADSHRTAAVAALGNVGEVGAVAEAVEAFVGWAWEVDLERPAGGADMEPEPPGDIRFDVVVREVMCAACDRVSDRTMSGPCPLAHFAKTENSWSVIGQVVVRHRICERMLDLETHWGSSEHTLCPAAGRNQP